MFVFSVTACSDKNETAKKTKDGRTIIRLVMKDESSSNPSSKAYFDALEKALKKDENINVDIQLVDMPQGTYSEKLNLLLSGGDIPDIIYFQGGDLQMSKQDLLEDLTPYVKDSKYIKNILEPYNEKRLKNYPYLLWIKPLSQSTPVIRQDWFDKTKSGKALESDPSPENYYQFFKDLKDNPPGGSGKPKYAITTAGEIKDLDFIFNMAFGIDQTWLDKGNGTYEYAKTSDQEKKKLEYYNKLYKGGLLDPQFLTKKWDTKEKAFYDGESAVIVGTAGKVIDIYNGKMKQVNGEEAAVHVLPPAKGEEQGFGATDITKEERGVAISSQSKNKKVAFKILDYLASPKGQMLDRIGFEKEEYNVVDDQIELTDKYYNEWFARFWEPSEFKPDHPLKKPLLSEPAQKSQDEVKKYYQEDNSFIIPEEYVSNWDAMENLYKEYATDIITGKRPLKDFDEFVKKWKEAGGDELTKYANKTIK